MVTKNYHFFVTGMVQGVGYRFFTIRKASEYGLTGYVRNTREGKVEIEIQGEEEKISCFLDDLHQGPGMSEVKGFAEFTEQEVKEYSNFEIRY